MSDLATMQSDPLHREAGAVSLKWKILVGNLLTSFFAMAFACVLAWSSWGDLGKREQAARVLDAFELVMKVNAQIPLERNVWNVLAAPAPLSTEDAAKLDQSVASTDEMLSRAKSSTKAAGLSMKNIDAAEQTLRSVRSAARAAAVLPGAQRPANIQVATIDGLGRAGDSLTAAIDEAAIELVRMGGDVENLLPSAQLAQLSQSMRTVNGARSAVLRFFIQNIGWTPVRLSEVTETSGQVTLLWQQIELAARSIRDTPEVSAALEHVRSTLMGDGERRYRQIVAAARDGQPSPISVDEWGRWTSPMLNNVNLLRDAALKSAHQSIDRAMGAAQLRLVIALGVLLLVALVSVAVVIGVVRGVIGPLVGLTGVTLRLANGELSADIPNDTRKDEIGAMARALKIFKDALIAKKESDEAAQRDAQAQIDRARRLDTLTRNFEATIADIVNTVSSAASGLETSADTLTGTANRSKELSTVVAAASEEASANVQSVASATEELSSSVTEISRQVQTSARMAGDAVQQVRQTNSRVAELSQAAARIGDVVELINTIAGQTNLLALNATIEAARAGEAGRGFAVVATEVKALAEQTAKATDEISQQISGVQAATQESVNAIQAISTTIERLAEIGAAIAAAVEEQGAATQEISRNVQQAAHGTQQVSSNITDVQRGAAQTGSASAEVLSSAKSLAGDSNRLKREVGNFLEAVRAA
ncbi:putative receptor/sensory transducer [Bradyrhizobium sp. ORS 285]|uniref:methyl-accepting chemotaxis protein n=1 Tax=Bradyrhizobium sp. ORS 285 TaxID=115808 RepID=UPI00024061DB|nr:HAMP domain-containing methyl-accepting chemotaxis protein [Bradyrhizobium sp. ORS 285]CCD86594.1 putative receptor/sensory transducer [Bradyrhizobium sp. ORS 285]SMX59730.1 putative receptor/sensory transducer [Bradyrhizobium sp. ORS 285]